MCSSHVVARPFARHIHRDMQRHNFQSELSGAFPRLFSCMYVTTLSSFLSHCTYILSLCVCLSLSHAHTHYARLARPLSSLLRSCFSPFSLSFPSFTTHAYISTDIILFYHSHIHDIPHAAVSLYLHGGCVCVCVCVFIPCERRIIEPLHLLRARSPSGALLALRCEALTLKPMTYSKASNRLGLRRRKGDGDDADSDAQGTPSRTQCGHEKRDDWECQTYTKEVHVGTWKY